MPPAQPSGPGPYPTQPYAGYSAPPTGRLSWALGFLAYIPIPFLNLLVTAVVMVCVYPAAKRKGVPLASENARYAANWGITIFTVYAACVVYAFGLASVMPQVTQGFFPLGAVILVYFALAIVHLVVTIWGTVVSGKRVFRNRLAIPCLRPSR